MKLNYDYCKLDENAMLRYAPSIIKDDSGYHANPPQELYAANGWYRKTATPPEAAEGRYCVENEPKNWAWDKETMTVAMTYHEEVVPVPEPIPKRYNKNALADAIVEAGKFAELNALFAKNPVLLFRWNSALEFVEDDKSFVQFRAMLVEEFGEETVAAILAKAEA